MDGIRVEPITEETFDGYYQCLDSVARERIYLAGVEARPRESTLEFVRNNIKNGYPHFIALDGVSVVGWCDIIPRRGFDFEHCGTLGMGLHKDYRGRGIGTTILDEALKAAKKYGLEKVELEVYTSNKPAVNLYLKRGFVTEGVRRRARKLDGDYFDIQAMALFLEP